LAPFARALLKLPNEADSPLNRAKSARPHFPMTLLDNNARLPLSGRLPCVPVGIESRSGGLRDDDFWLYSFCDFLRRDLCLEQIASGRNRREYAQPEFDEKYTANRPAEGNFRGTGLQRLGRSEAAILSEVHARFSRALPSRPIRGSSTGERSPVVLLQNPYAIANGSAGTLASGLTPATSTISQSGPAGTCRVSGCRAEIDAEAWSRLTYTALV
jgi:hypothetical protein